MSEDWPKLRPSEMGPEEFERMCLRLGQDDFRFKDREAALANGRRILEGREAEFTTLRPAASRVKVKVGADGVYRAGGARLEQRWIDQFEQNNSQRNSCCRHPEEMTVSAWYSSADDEAKGIPDIYVFHCTCGRIHRRFCLGGSDKQTGKGMRPKWITDADVRREHEGKVPFYEMAGKLPADFWERA